MPSKADIPDALTVPLPLTLALALALLLRAVAALPHSKGSVCAQQEEAPAISKPMLKTKVEPKVKPQFELEPKPVLEVLSKLMPMPMPMPIPEPMPEPSQADNLLRTNPLTQDTSNGTINS